MEMRFGTWNVRSLYRAGSLVTVSKELSKYKLDFVRVQARWEGGGAVITRRIHFSTKKGMRAMSIGESYQYNIQ
jgi:hypothetical protein